MDKAVCDSVERKQLWQIKEIGTIKEKPSILHWDNGLGQQALSHQSLTCEYANLFERRDLWCRNAPPPELLFESLAHKEWHY